VRRVLLATAIAMTALVLQAVGFDRIPLPLGRPDLPLVCVVALSLAAGPTFGTVAGFCIGLAADSLPPADHTLGRLALAYAVVGYLAGLLEDVEERSVFATVAIVAGASVVAVILFGGVGALVGDHRISAESLLRALGVVVLYDVVLAPLVVPLISALVRRTEPAV
jgi:rod shape-determining protein MreD